MRCSKSEALFDGLLDGTLTPVQRLRVEQHLEACARCSNVLEELRVIDALLLGPRILEPAPNFTFKTMAEIRAMPAPKAMAPRWPLWAWAALYLAASWLGIGAWFAVGRPDAPALLAFGLSLFGHAGGALYGIARVVASGFGFGYNSVAGVVSLVIVADIALVGLALATPHVIARLARSESA